MPKKYPPLTLAEILEILQCKGFVNVNTVGSHAQYVKKENGETYRVTVKVNAVDFGDFLIKSMISQSGMSREEFYGACRSAARKIGKR